MRSLSRQCVLPKQERWLDPNYVYATSTAGQTAAQTQPGSESSSPTADSNSDESWVDVGKSAPVVDPEDLSNRPKRWYPFSEGARSCVGQSLANMNLAGTLATLLARFHFRLADQVLPPPPPLSDCYRHQVLALMSRFLLSEARCCLV